MIRRVVIPDLPLVRGPCSLDRAQSHYLRDVLRLRQGDAITLMDGAGHEADAVLVGLTNKEVVLEVSETRTRPEPPGPKICLIQAVGKGDKMDSIVRQCTELGVRAIVPIQTERTVVERRGRLDRWQTIAVDAIRVSGRPRLPKIESPIPFEELLARPRAGVSLVFAGQATRSLAACLRENPEPTSIEVLIGPEGGLSEAERARAIEAGFEPVQLGDYTLRTETAGPAVVAALMLALGGFDKSPDIDPNPPAGK